MGLGQTYYTHRGMYTPSSSTSHFVAPCLPHFQQTSFSSRGKDSTQGQGSGEKVTHTQGQPGHGSLTDTSRSSLEEDQRSDNTVPAGYMVVDAVQEAVAPNFHDFELPLPETMRYVTPCRTEQRSSLGLRSISSLCGILETYIHTHALTRILSISLHVTAAMTHSWRCWNS